MAPQRVVVDGVVAGLRFKADVGSRVAECRLQVRILEEDEAVGVMGQDVLLARLVGSLVRVTFDSLQGSFAVEGGKDGPEFRAVGG